MSRVTRQKHILKEIMDDDYELPKSNQLVVRVVSSKGNNLHEVEQSDGSENFLVSMPTKFRKNIWVKRGDFVLIEPIEEGQKVKAEIVRILTQEHIKEYTKNNVWPKKFTKKRENIDEENIDLNFVKNLNRPQFDPSAAVDESSEDEDE